jgi:PAS domain S-box-containing protein
LERRYLGFGKDRWLELRICPVPGGLVSFYRDITERKRAEEALRASEERFRALVEAVPHQVWEAGPDGQVEWFNGRFYEFTGATVSDLKTGAWGRVIHPEDQADIKTVIKQLSAGITPYGLQNRLRHRDGSYRWIAWTAVPDARFIHAVGRDITGEKEAAHALQQAEEALRQSQKMEAVGQLTGGIAHDFNNLLTGVIGSLDLIQTRIAQGRAGDIGRYIDAAMSSANRAAALTHRLLAFSRRQPLDPKPIDANELVASMDELVRRTTSEAIRVELCAAEGLWLTSCDPNQLENALLNLVINARDAMPDGGSLIIETGNAELDDAYVATHRDVVPGQYVALSVTDTGSGMSNDVLERVFEPFFTTKPIGQGTGLGLSMVYGFVKQSGGHIRITSEIGKGTTVRIYLPRYLGPAQLRGVSVIEVAESRAKADETVLVVEDEPVVRDLIVSMLQDIGYNVLEAADGPEGLGILQSDQRIDLLLTDVGLPGLNGRQLADAARTRRPDLKIMFMTGYVESGLLASGLLRAGMEVIAKPFAFEALAAKVGNMLHAG